MGDSRIAFDPAPANTSHKLLGASEKRVGIRFFPPQGETATLSNEPSVVLNKGVTLQQGQSPIRFSLKKDGKIVQKEWYVIGSLGTNPVAYQEIFP